MTLKELLIENQNEERCLDQFSDLSFNRHGTITYLSPTYNVRIRTHNPPDRDLLLMNPELRNRVIDFLTRADRRHTLILSEVE